MGSVTKIDRRCHKKMYRGQNNLFVANSIQFRQEDNDFVGKIIRFLFVTNHDIALKKIIVDGVPQRSELIHERRDTVNFKLWHARLKRRPPHIHSRTRRQKNGAFAIKTSAAGGPFDPAAHTSKAVRKQPASAHRRALICSNKGCKRELHIHS